MLGTITGGIEKATLWIKKTEIMEKAAEDNSGGGVFGTLKKGYNAVKSGYQKASQAVNNFEKRMSSLSNLLNGGPEVDTEKFIPLEVQYNPASVRIYTTGSGSGGYLIGSNNVTQASTLISQTLMDFELIFEDINNQDAFDITSMGFNVETIYGLAKDIGTNLLEGPYGVINQVQGLLGLISNIEMQEVVFVWGDMAFKGRLTDVNVEYTMFNKDGNPILAKVKMSIQHVYEEEDTSDIKYWDKVIKDMFKRHEHTSSYR